MDNEKIVKIEMMDYTGEIVNKEFILKKTITPFHFIREAAKISDSVQGTYEQDLAFAVKFFPEVIGRESFYIEGVDKELKFLEILEEFFINDPFAISNLVVEVGFFLNPASSKKKK